MSAGDGPPGAGPPGEAATVLAVNAGSSSLKLSLIDGAERTLASAELDRPGRGQEPDAARLHELLDARFEGAQAVGHRIVHGGERFREAVLIEPGVERELRALSDLAPLHQPVSLRALDAVREATQQLPQVACFDTAFHASIPPAATTYALPAAWREHDGLRRYGFHGLSHAWASRRACELLGREPAELAIVSCHLGAGASLCAIADGRSLDTTMGFTPLEGLVMATRCGSVDPGLLVWMLEREALSARELGDALEHSSGLLGLAGSSDMREVIARTQAGEPRAGLAFAVYIHRLRACVAAMVASLGRLDALVFTGGVGERAPAVRAAAAAGLGFLGVHIDPRRNEDAHESDADVSAGGASVRTLVVGSREDIEIARQVRALLAR